jgi:hypothetical protein
VPPAHLERDGDVGEFLLGGIRIRRTLESIFAAGVHGRYGARTIVVVTTAGDDVAEVGMRELHELVVGYSGTRNDDALRPVQEVTLTEGVDGPCIQAR